MADNNEETAAINGLSKEQKIGFVLLLLFAFFVVALGFLQIRNTMRRPFALNNSVPPSIKDDVNSVDSLRFRDTDRDGLNDFDELYVYNTSPYLADTDSDGISDKDEVDQGSDPLCAQGKECLNVESDAQSAGGVSTTVGTFISPPEPIQSLDATSFDLMSLLTDPAQIRAMLLNSGLKPEVLDNISDSELLQMVADSFTATPGSSSGENISLLNGLISSSSPQQ